MTPESNGRGTSEATPSSRYLTEPESPMREASRSRNCRRPAAAMIELARDGFWSERWGERPGAPSAAEEIARSHAKNWPVVIPIWGHRYAPAKREGINYSVFSIYESDVVFVGTSMADYIRREYAERGAMRPSEGYPGPESCPPWSQLARTDYDII
jgi:hypothetical protein